MYAQNQSPLPSRRPGGAPLPHLFLTLLHNVETAFGSFFRSHLKPLLRKLANRMQWVVSARSTTVFGTVLPKRWWSDELRGPYQRNRALGGHWEKREEKKAWREICRGMSRLARGTRFPPTFPQPTDAIRLKTVRFRLPTNMAQTVKVPMGPMGEVAWVPHPQGFFSPWRFH